MKGFNPRLDIELAEQIPNLDIESLACLAALYARWGRQLRAVVRYKRKLESGQGLSASEQRYCELEGIPAAEFIKAKGGTDR